MYRIFLSFKEKEVKIWQIDDKKIFFTNLDQIARLFEIGNYNSYLIKWNLI